MSNRLILLKISLLSSLLIIMYLGAHTCFLVFLENKLHFELRYLNFFNTFFTAFVTFEVVFEYKRQLLMFFNASNISVNDYNAFKSNAVIFKTTDKILQV